jgi:hypothetical protein
MPGRPTGLPEVPDKGTKAVGCHVGAQANKCVRSGQAGCVIGPGPEPNVTSGALLQALLNPKPAGHCVCVYDLNSATPANAFVLSPWSSVLDCEIAECRSRRRLSERDRDSSPGVSAEVAAAHICGRIDPPRTAICKSCCPFPFFCVFCASSRLKKQASPRFTVTAPAISITTQIALARSVRIAFSNSIGLNRAS